MTTLQKLSIVTVVEGASIGNRAQRRAVESVVAETYGVPQYMVHRAHKAGVLEELLEKVQAADRDLRRVTFIGQYNILMGKV